MAKAEELRKIFRENCIKFQVALMCKFACIEPVDSTDGSTNWWVFQKEATDIVDDIMKRFPIPDEVLEQANDKA